MRCKEKIVFRMEPKGKHIEGGGVVGEVNCYIKGKVDRGEVNRRIDEVVVKAIGNPTEDGALLSLWCSLKYLNTPSLKF